MECRYSYPESNAKVTIWLKMAAKYWNIFMDKFV